MHFNWEIGVGNLFTGIALIVGLWAAHTQNIRRLERIETRLEMIYSWFTKKIIEGRED